MKAEVWIVIDADGGYGIGKSHGDAAKDHAATSVAKTIVKAIKVELTVALPEMAITGWLILENEPATITG